MTLNYLIWLFVRPSHLILVTAVLGTCLLRWKSGRVLCSATAILVVIFGLLPTAGLLIRPLELRFAQPSNLADIDGVIVLAGSEIQALSEIYGQPQLNSMGDRLTTFLLLAHEHPDARLVHSGRQEEAPRKLILGVGIDPERIVFENRSQNTCASARFTKEAVAPAPTEKWLLVTSAFHMPRAVACFRAVDWEIIPFPADYRTGRSLLSLDLIGNLSNLDLAIHEWVGLLYYRVRGVTDDLFPGPLREE